jgi:hypothetical protein
MQQALAIKITYNKVKYFSEFFEFISGYTFLQD